MNKGENHKN